MYRITIEQTSYAFPDLKALMAKATSAIIVVFMLIVFVSFRSCL